MDIDFKVKRAEDCILIDTKNWLVDGTGIEIRRMSGRDVPTCINKVLDVHAVNKELEDVVRVNDTVLLSHAASDIAQYRTFEIKRGDKRYFHCPIMQVLGVFNQGVISLENLTMCTDKILIKRIKEVNTGIIAANSNTMIGEVIKLGTKKFDKEWNPLPLSVSIGDKVLIRHNVTTKIQLKEGEFYATEDSMVVGKFTGEREDLGSLTVLNNYVILDSYVPEKIDSNLFTPLLDYENEDYTEIYNRDLFKVLKKDGSIDKISENDILLIDRNFTNYVYLGSKRYFLVSGMDYITSKIIR